jgi:hypothetical protein
VRPYLWPTHALCTSAVSFCVRAASILALIALPVLAVAALFNCVVQFESSPRSTNALARPSPRLRSA